MILGHFEHAFVINAETQKERLARVNEQLDSHGIEYERLEAIVPKSGRNGKPPGELGCTLSHYAAVQMAQERGYENVLIFEDDIILRANFATLWDEVAEQLKRAEYDLLYFYDWQNPAQHGDIRLIEISGSLCTHAYAVRRSYYSTYLALAKAAAEGSVAIDRKLKHAEGRKWAVIPNLVGQLGGRSMIYGFEKNLRWSALDG